MTPTIVGTGAFLPETRTTNEALVARGLDTSHDWIVSHTGIHARSMADAKQATSDLAVGAAKRALEDAGIAASELGYILCATSTPDHLLPPTANLVQSRLGATCGGVDLNGGCSGFVHALATGYALAGQSPDRPILVVGADTYSRIVDPEDRRTAVFFGDGAGAAVVAPREGTNQLLAVVSGSDGSLGELIVVPEGGSRLPGHGKGNAQRFLQMDGRRVWNFAVERVPELIRAVADRASVSLSEVDLIIPHQANAKMLHAIAERLNVPSSKLLCTVKDKGNTAAASTAIALHEAARSGALKPGSTVIMAGFGAGLSWCGLCLRWQPTGG